jgi:non-ribosomal peptide synthase protein (TIGR01720 family)
MALQEFLAELRRLGVRLWVDGDRLRYDAPPGVVTSALRAAIADRKAPIMAFLREANAVRPQEHSMVTGVTPLLCDQLWFLDEWLMPPNGWLIARVRTTPPDLDPAQLEQAIRQLQLHHDTLRACFRHDGTRWQQHVMPPSEDVPLRVLDMAGLSERQRHDGLQFLTWQLQNSIQQDRAPLFQIALCTFGAHEPGRLLILGHHLILDGTSMALLIEDLETACQQLRNGAAVELPARTTSIREWGERLHDYARSPTMRGEHDYWRSLPWGQTARLPLDFPENRERNTVVSGRLISGSLNAAETRSLQIDLPKRYNTPFNIVLLAALTHTLARWSGEPLIDITMVQSGRDLIPDAEDIDLSRTLGWLATSSIVIIDGQPDREPAAALTAITAQYRAIPNHGFGYTMLAQLSGDADLSAAIQTPRRKEVLFNHLGQLDPPAPTALFRPAPESITLQEREENKRFTILDCISVISDGCFSANWLYSEHLHKPETITQISAAYMRFLRDLIG